MMNINYIKNSGCEQKSKNFLGIEINSENIVLFSFIVLSLVISLLPIQYGYFRDELYYIALSKHLAWGYVDVPPLMPFCIAIMRFFFGESLSAIHIIPAIFGAIILVLTREIVKKLGGNLFAQTLALLCLVMAPMSISIYSCLTYDCFDHLFWALCLYSLVLLLTSENKKYWLYFGVFVGMGLMSKFGMLWLGLGIALAMLFTKERKYFLSWQFWIAGLIALLIVSPYLIWIVQHQFLTLEYFMKYTQATAPLTVWSFISDQIRTMNLLSFPIWALGLYYFLFHKEGKKFKLFGLAYIIITAVCIVQQAKFYMITPIYPILFAGGAIFIEKIARKSRTLYLSGIFYALLIVIVGLLLMPIVRPILPVNILIKYLNYTHLFQSGSKAKAEKLTQGILPQFFADRFGWEEMTSQVANIYHALPEKQRANTVIVAQNYGEASAIYFYSKKYQLPMPISQHLQYYVWGYQNATENSTFILVGYHNPDSLKLVCKKIKQVGKIYNKYAMPYENNPIFLCRGLQKPIKKIWKQGKNMHM